MTTCGDQLELTRSGGLRRAPSRPDKRRRAVALLLALMVLTVSATVAYSYLGTQGSSIGIARNIGDQARVRCLAETGLDLAVAYINTDTNWRTTQTNGTWVADYPLYGGEITVVVEDGTDTNNDGVISTPAEGDGDLANDPSKPFTISVRARLERLDDAGQVFASVTDLIRADVRIVGGDLTSSWLLDEGSGSTVSGGVGQIGTLTNMDPATCWVPGKSGTALSFNGNNGYVTMPDMSAVEITTAGTVSAWININSFKNAFAGIVHKGTRTDFKDEAYSLQFWTGNRIYWGITTASGAHPSVISPTAPPVGEWIHVLGSWDSSAMRLYVNGVQVASGAGVESIRSTGAFNLGAQLNASPYYSYDGLIDDVRVYNRALTAAEVAAIAGGAPPESTLWTYLVDPRL